MLPVEECENRIGYQFRDRQYLVRALTHRSKASESANRSENADNEQLEFLGDSVLGFLASEELLVHSPAAREGELSKLKSHLVSATHLYECALALGLGEFLVLGKGEERSGGRERKTLLADAMEAIIGAIHLDGGVEPARRFVRAHILNALEDPAYLALMAEYNHKSILQERVQALGLPPPRYVTVGTAGPEHSKLFIVEGRVGDQFTARASASSKKAASQAAAAELLAQVNSTP